MQLLVLVLTVTLTVLGTVTEVHSQGFNWTNWSSCNETCGTGWQFRTRSCSGSSCPTGFTSGTESQGRSCFLRSCTNPGGGGGSGRWGEWTPYSVCDVTCGSGGRQTRSRTCNGIGCPGGSTFRSETQWRSCNNINCDPIGPRWTEWTTWSTCNVTCGFGGQSRTRTCRGAGCPRGFTFYTENRFRSCNEISCTPPPGASWTEWTAWSACNVTCGSGSQTITRTCTGVGCPRGSTFYRENRWRSCDEGPCTPPEGSWSDWEPWSSCDVTCDWGRQTSSRRCLSAQPCDGSSEKILACNPGDCPAWNNWSEWSECSQTCNQGRETRSRSCSQSNMCAGRAEDNRECFLEDCSPDSSLFQCSFEQPCSVFHIPDAQFNWTRINGGTDSGDTGPSSDHSQGNGFYYYTEASSPRREGDKAKLMTSLLSPTTSAICLRFWYHMYGAEMGTLNVYLSQGTNVHLIFSISGNQGDVWHVKDIYIPVSSGTFNIIFEAVIGSDYTSDIAIDDVSIYFGEDCDRLEPPDQIDVFEIYAQPNANPLCYSNQTSPGRDSHDQGECTCYAEETLKSEIILKKGYSELMRVQLLNCVDVICLIPGAVCCENSRLSCRTKPNKDRCDGSIEDKHETAFKEAARKWPHQYHMKECHQGRCDVEVLVRPRFKCVCQ